MQAFSLGEVFLVHEYKLMARAQYEQLGNPLALPLDLKHVPLEMYEARNAAADRNRLGKAGIGICARTRDCIPRGAVAIGARAISFRCQANKVSGVTIVATSARSLRPNPLALAANRRR